MKPISAIILITVLILSACSPFAFLLNACPSRNELLGELEGLVPYEEYSLSFNTSKGISSLTLWFVDPDLNSHAEEGLLDALSMTLLEATTVIHQMHQTDACVGKLFDFANLIIVDPDYVGMFSGVLSLENIPDTPALSEDELVALVTSFQVDYRLRDPMAPFNPPGDTACSWPETREKIIRNFPVSSMNVDFFYVFDALGSTVWAQFTGPIEGGTTGYATIKIKQIIEELGCLYPPANKIYTIIVDGEGEVTLVGSISAVEEATEDTVNGFDINDYTFSLLLEPEEE